MPLTLTLTEGALPDGAEAQAIARIADAFLAAHDLSGNRTMTPNVTANVSILPPAKPGAPADASLAGQGSADAINLLGSGHPLADGLRSREAVTH